MNRRSFLIGLDSTGLSTSVPLQLKRSEATDTESPNSYWDALSREEKILRLAERVVPRTDPEELTVTPANLNSAASIDESCLPLLVGQQIEKEILLRRVRTHFDDGNSSPDEPIVLKRPRWRK